MSTFLLSYLPTFSSENIWQLTFLMNIKDINVNFDFTTDTKSFWDGFWEGNNGLGAVDTAGSGYNVTVNKLSRQSGLTGENERTEVNRLPFFSSGF